VNSFELKLFRLVRSTGANDCQNYTIYTQEQRDLERLLLLKSSEQEKRTQWTRSVTFETLIVYRFPLQLPTDLLSVITQAQYVISKSKFS